MAKIDKEIEDLLKQGARMDEWLIKVEKGEIEVIDGMKGITLKVTNEKRS